MLLPNRHGSSDGYRYGFNGMEKDDEVKGEGVQYDYGFRIYDARLGKFLSTDPLSANFPWYTPYQFAGNKPIWAIDLDGLEELIFQDSFKPYIKGLNQIIITNDKLIEEYNNIQKEEKNHIKIFFNVRNMMGESHGDANGKTKDYTSHIHAYIKLKDYFSKGGTLERLSEKNMNTWNLASKTAELLGIKNATDLSLDNKYFSVSFNSRFTAPTEVGKDYKGYEWEGLLGTNVNTIFHEVKGHVLKQLESMYKEHDYLFGFTKYSDYYTEEELKKFKEEGYSPSKDRIHPESVMGKIIVEINKSIEILKAQEKEKEKIDTIKKSDIKTNENNDK